MRISDWSSDVCSSDLAMADAAARSPKPFNVSWSSAPEGIPERLAARSIHAFAEPARAIRAMGKLWPSRSVLEQRTVPWGRRYQDFDRSEERRGGKEGGRTCCTRWSPCHEKKKK